MFFGRVVFACPFFKKLPEFLPGLPGKHSTHRPRFLAVLFPLLPVAAPVTATADGCPADMECTSLIPTAWQYWGTGIGGPVDPSCAPPASSEGQALACSLDTVDRWDSQCSHRLAQVDGSWTPLEWSSEAGITTRERKYFFIEKTTR